MKIKTIKIMVIACLISLGLTFQKTSFSQESTSAKSNSIRFEEYEIHFFGHTKGSTPHSIIRLDNNGEILLACRTGQTVEQLKASNIGITQSQIGLLQDWRLLKKEGNLLRTNFLILDSSRTEYLRKITKEASLKIAPKLMRGVSALKKSLKSKGHEKNTYTILFSYVLDNLVWGELGEAKLIMKRKITAEKPFYGGFLWAIYPPRDFFCGTNSSIDHGVCLYLNWSKVGAKLIFSLYSDFEAYYALLEDLKKYGKVKNEKVKQLFNPYRIFDSEGNFTVPVIVEDTSDSFYQLCKSLSQKVAKQVVRVLTIQDLKKDLDLKDSDEAIVVLYHEIMWDLLEQFEEMDIIQKPMVFTYPEGAKLKDVADLIFIVKQTDAE